MQEFLGEQAKEAASGERKPRQGAGIAGTSAPGMANRAAQDGGTLRSVLAMGAGQMGNRQVNARLQGGGVASAASPQAGRGEGGPSVELRPGPDAPHPVAEQMDEPGVQFRVPNFADLQKIYTDPKLKIPEAVVQDRVRLLLERMDFEGRLKSKKPNDLDAILRKIFPKPGVIDQAEFEKVIDTADRKMVYEDAADASTKIKKDDRAKLQAAMGEACALIKKVAADQPGLEVVFGTKANEAKAFYGQADAALDAISKDLDAHVTTDYNLDDPESFVGGWANFSTQHLHLGLETAQGKDKKDAIVTLIHESCHLADGSIIDQGYYGTPGFEGLEETVKIANAAHYEELPRRDPTIGTSEYAAVKKFEPGKKASGGVETTEDKIRTTVSEKLRMAWDAAADVHMLVRRVSQGGHAEFLKHKDFLLEASRMENLTLHTQDPNEATATTLDVTLAEGVARGLAIIQSYAKKVKVDESNWLYQWFYGSDLDTQPPQVIEQAAAKYRNLLTRDPKKDKVLIDWLAVHYKNVR